MHFKITKTQNFSFPAKNCSWFRGNDVNFMQLGHIAPCFPIFQCHLVCWSENLAWSHVIECSLVHSIVLNIACNIGRRPSGTIGVLLQIYSCSIGLVWCLVAIVAGLNLIWLPLTSGSSEWCHIWIMATKPGPDCHTLPVCCHTTMENEVARKCLFVMEHSLTILDIYFRHHHSRPCIASFIIILNH